MHKLPREREARHLVSGQAKLLHAQKYILERMAARRTILRIEKLAYNVPMKNDDFTVQALRREQ